ncbi:MAG TPA: flagellar export chaperone FlgN [Acidimicrobiia bacterium]|nr:flagellar export chaperone FlgN [Acidimicrobiia bacterium]
MALSDASNILWRERQLVELLVFKLEEEQLVFAAGRNRWLAHARREVENVVAEIRRVELEWAVQVADTGRELGIPDAPTLRDLASLTPTPWDAIFAEHRRALIDLAGEIEAIRASNRELSRRGQGTAHPADGAKGDIDIGAYDVDDADATLPDRSLVLRILDEAI